MQVVNQEIRLVIQHFVPEGQEFGKEDLQRANTQLRGTMISDPIVMGALETFIALASSHLNYNAFRNVQVGRFCETKTQEFTEGEFEEITHIDVHV